MALLDIIQRASLLLGIPQPTSAISNTDQTYTQMVAFAQLDGDEVAASFDWRSLKIAGQITGDGSTTLFTLPSDFERLLPGEAFYSNSYPTIPLIGPLMDDEFLAAKALPVMPIRPIWRLLGGTVEIWPALANGEIVNTQYRSSNWVLAADGVTRKPAYTADTDTALFNERILSLGVVWRWKRSKGLDYEEEFRTYQMTREQIAGHDAGNRVIYMHRNYRLPDNFWPGMISVTP